MQKTNNVISSQNSLGVTVKDVATKIQQEVTIPSWLKEIYEKTGMEVSVGISL